MIHSTGAEEETARHLLINCDVYPPGEIEASVNIKFVWKTQRDYVTSRPGHFETFRILRTETEFPQKEEGLNESSGHSA